MKTVQQSTITDTTRSYIRLCSECCCTEVLLVSLFRLLATGVRYCTVLSLLQALGITLFCRNCAVGMYSTGSTTILTTDMHILGHAYIRNPGNRNPFRLVVESVEYYELSVWKASKLANKQMLCPC